MSQKGRKEGAIAEALVASLLKFRIRLLHG